MTAATTGRCRNGFYSGNLNVFAISAMLVVLATTFVYAQDIKEYNELSGPLCQRIKKCCKERKDECSVPVAGTRCYCDAFCMNSTSHDCCPDYWTYCRNENPPPGGFVRGTRAPEQPSELLANPESCSSYGDELDVFFKSIAATVRKFPQPVIVETKIRIFQIVSQSERLNTNCSVVH